MKKVSFPMFLLALVLLGNSCKKDKLIESPPGSVDKYISLKDFYRKNGVQTEVFTVDAAKGGIFTSAKGSVVTIPANCFVDQAGHPVTGMVSIEFKDIYQKSDMLLSDIPTMLHSGSPLKSGGEFFIRAKSGGKGVYLNGSQAIKVKQPSGNWLLDNGMQGFTLSVADTLGWRQDSSWVSADSLTSSYIFSLYHLWMPADSGTWGNSDNAAFFSAYSQTQLTLHAANHPTPYAPAVFLLFSGINSAVHVYYSGSDNYIYKYAPVGLKCTLVAVGIGSDGSPYSSFVPITISANQTVNFTLNQTTTADFKTQLNTLNH